MTARKPKMAKIRRGRRNKMNTCLKRAQKATIRPLPPLMAWREFREKIRAPRRAGK